ncbi:MAG: iron-sulfur cluster assembly scaffold protein [Pedosphaera parvula]|nr:iron-sulfur cluster assembly scaffold protein [Pedosphaera parvula]
MDNLQQKIAEAIRNPQNMGELRQADAVGTVGSPECGEMLRLWIKFKEERGKKVIDRATFQSFGCETAIAVASLATELIRGKTPEEDLALSSADLAADLGPLPPMKIHCSQLVEGALRSALAPENQTAPAPGSAPAPPQSNLSAGSGNLLDSLAQANQPSGSKRIILLDKKTD